MTDTAAAQFRTADLARCFEQGRGALVIEPSGHGWTLTSVQPHSLLHIIATYTHASGVERTVMLKVVS